MKLRVATYNIHKGVINDLFGLRRVSRIHELRDRLHTLDADLVFLQEVQGRHERHAKRFEHWPAEPQDQFLAKSPTLRHSFETAYGRNANYLHGHHGNALLSRFPIVHQDNRDVSDHALESRGILHCVIRMGKRPVHCFVIHFGLLARSRERQSEALIDWIEREVPRDAPLLIAGDFNDWRNQLSRELCGRLGVREAFDAAPPRGRIAQRVASFVGALGAPRTGEAIRALMTSRPQASGVGRVPRRVRAASTFPSLMPWLPMDRIYLRGFEVRAARVMGGPGWARLSDHSPLVADLTLRS